MITIKRIYEEASAQDGFRILVDRIWPRGVSKDKAKLDLWLKEVAPSNELRKAFHGKKMEWAEFKKRYLKELGNCKEHLEVLRKKAEEGKVTLVYGAKDEEQNQAVVLREVLSFSE